MAIETIADDIACWICGNAFNRTVKKTMHHTIPKHLKPQRNMVVPICEACHNRVNAEDPQAILNFSYKMMKTLIEQNAMVAQLVQLAEQRAGVKK